MFKVNKLFLLSLALVLMLSMAMSVVGCGGEETAPVSSSKSVSPKAGATFTGPIDISGKASSGTIEFTVSADGTSITSVSITMKDLECNGFSAGSMTKETSGTFAIDGSRVSASPSGIGEIEGRFTSSTEASGTIDMTLEIPFFGPCSLGEWNWSAEAD